MPTGEHQHEYDEGVGFRTTVTRKGSRWRSGRSPSPPGFFYPEEVDTAVELVEDRLLKGPRCGYHFLFAEQDGRTVGYTSFGPIACTKESYDLYWIVVAGRLPRQGAGTQLLEQAEESIASFGGTRVYIETSARPFYAAHARVLSSPAATPSSRSWRTSTPPATRRRCT